MASNLQRPNEITGYVHPTSVNSNSNTKIYKSFDAEDSTNNEHKNVAIRKGNYKTFEMNIDFDSEYDVKIDDTFR